ncbi:mechanosensitive ion channel family protein [Halobium salinum]|uniref:Mechanosensitive ion channel family protein n=1 Tax=Halobium salinum TaxID=1364940 RepID=A0ABD5P9I5_9EURY|nr:mechanosensitive ion channel domain-containing protein [Halobium salinum]
MNRPTSSVAFLLAFLSAVVGAVVTAAGPFGSLPLLDVPLSDLVVKLAYVSAVALGAFGVYGLLLQYVVERAASRRRAHDVRNVLRLALGAVALVAALGVVTEQWVGVLFSLGVVGFAVTFALQQPLLSLIAWGYIVVERPFAVGDRVEIEGVRGDVVAVDFLVTTLWEVNGGLVSTNQPSGRVVTVPNSVVLSSQVVTFGEESLPWVWNEFTVQVAYETDLAFVRDLLVEETTDYLGDEMGTRIANYRRRLARTPVDLEVAAEPTVNVVAGDSWVELSVRYVVPTRKATSVRNELYERALRRLNEHPDRVSFPVGRNR